ncbi:MAG: DUF3747 domain-containing protein [Elainellaceae cyanobacterium]
MTLSIRRFLGAIATTSFAAMGAVTAFSPAIAATFGEKIVDQNKFVAVAAPYGVDSHQLLILEQVANTQACWREFGNAPVQIDPLLVNFNFTGICSRSTDSNGYSVRVDGEDLGLRYRLRVVEQGDKLVLLGAPDDPTLPTLEIGQADGMSDDFVKLNLNSGWQFTKRTYNDSTLGHVYLSYNSTIPGIETPDSGGQPGNTVTFPDTRGDIYAMEIEEAVSLGFVAGFFEDNTFRPRESLTREQLVSMVLESLDRLPDVDIDIAANVASSPYPDVQASRWSAAKIKFARDNNIVSGYQDGRFRPNQPVTRAEMMAVLRRAAEYGKTLRQLDSTLMPQQEAFSFADTETHWANRVIDQMSSYCGVASPLNEVGNNFSPDGVSQRNYAAAATLRMLNCVGAEGTVVEEAEEAPAAETGTAQG